MVVILKGKCCWSLSHKYSDWKRDKEQSQLSLLLSLNKLSDTAKQTASVCLATENTSALSYCAQWNTFTEIRWPHKLIQWITVHRGPFIMNLMTVRKEFGINCLNDASVFNWQNTFGIDFFFFLQIKQQESKQTRENPTKIFILIITEEPQSALKIYW